jgi:hypothetical protein
MSCHINNPSERISQPANADQVVADTVAAAETVFGAEIEALYTLGAWPTVASLLWSATWMSPSSLHMRTSF